MAREGKTKKSSYTRVEKNKNSIKKEIMEENDNKKYIVVALILALLLAIFAYWRVTKDNKESNDNKEKKNTIVEKNDKSDISDNKDNESKKNDSRVSVLETVAKETVKKVNTVKSSIKENNTSDDNTRNDEQVVNKYYAITFEVNGGENIEKQILKEDEKTSNVIPTRENWVFDGWYKDSNFEEPFIFGDVLTSDITIYAKWVKYLRFVSDNEIISENLKVSEGSVIPLLTRDDLPTQLEDNYEVSWRLNDINGAEVLPGTIFSSDLIETNDEYINLALYKLTKFELQFFLNENSIEPLVTKQVVENRKVSLEDVNSMPELENYEDIAWYYLDADGTKVNFSDGQLANVNITKLYLSDIYTVIYKEHDDDDYKVVGEQKVAKDSKIDEILTPSKKENKEFTGWFITDENGNLTDEKLTNETIIDRDLNVVGKYQEISNPSPLESEEKTALENPKPDEELIEEIKETKEPVTDNPEKIIGDEAEKELTIDEQ